LEQKLKQDQKVLKKAELVHQVWQLWGSGDSWKPLIAYHSVCNKCQEMKLHPEASESQHSFESDRPEHLQYKYTEE
jgi:hypothetical protein